jgi:hypothetical protein
MGVPSSYQPVGEGGNGAEEGDTAAVNMLKEFFAKNPPDQTTASILWIKDPPRHLEWLEAADDGPCDTEIAAVLASGSLPYPGPHLICGCGQSFVIMLEGERDSMNIGVDGNGCTMGQEQRRFINKKLAELLGKRLSAAGELKGDRGKYLRELLAKVAGATSRPASQP